MVQRKEEIHTNFEELEPAFEYASFGSTCTLKHLRIVCIVIKTWKKKQIRKQISHTNVRALRTESHWMTVARLLSICCYEEKEEKKTEK